MIDPSQKTPRIREESGDPTTAVACRRGPGYGSADDPTAELFRPFALEGQSPAPPAARGFIGTCAH